MIYLFLKSKTINVDRRKTNKYQIPEAHKLNVLLLSSDFESMTEVDVEADVCRTGSLFTDRQLRSTTNQFVSWSHSCEFISNQGHSKYKVTVMIIRVDYQVLTTCKHWSHCGTRSRRHNMNTHSKDGVDLTAQRFVSTHGGGWRSQETDAGTVSGTRPVGQQKHVGVRLK